MPGRISATVSLPGPSAHVSPVPGPAVPGGSASLSRGFLPLLASRHVPRSSLCSLSVLPQVFLHVTSLSPFVRPGCSPLPEEEVGAGIRACLVLMAPSLLHWTCGGQQS